MIIGKDKMDDDIIVKIDLEGESSEEDKTLAPLVGMCYFSLSEHFRHKCENVVI